MTWAERNILTPYSVGIWVEWDKHSRAASEDEAKAECEKRGWHFEATEDADNGIFLIGLPPEIESELEQEGFFEEIEDREFRAGTTIRVSVTIEMP